MFKKGSFELNETVYPIALKYRNRFGDPFWNSQTTSFPRHLFDLMTSWALVCDAYYLDPLQLLKNKTSIQFENRVRQAICEKARLTYVHLDGFLKRHKISPESRQRRQVALANIAERRIHGDVPRETIITLLNNP